MTDIEARLRMGQVAWQRDPRNEKDDIALAKLLKDKNAEIETLRAEVAKLKPMADNFYRKYQENNELLNMVVKHKDEIERQDAEIETLRAKVRLLDPKGQLDERTSTGFKDLS